MKIEDSYDVIVIGAGPAGSTTAKYAAKKGASVLVVDKHHEIGSPKRCGEGLGIRAFNELKIPKDQRFLNREIRGFAVYAPDRKKVEISYSKTMGYVLERKIFDKFLASEATRAGADVCADTLASLVKDTNGRITGIKTTHFDETREIEGKIIVSADGVDSVIARDAGINSVLNPSHMDSCLEYEMVGIDIDKPDHLHLYMGNNVAPRGYLWIFPKDDDRANVGIGISGTEKKTAKYYLDKFISENKWLKKGSTLEVNVGAVPVGGFLDEMVKDNVLVVGDAARQVNPIHGGGIYEAMTAGKIAGEKISNAIESEDLKILKEYETEWWATHGDRLKKVLRVRNFAEKLSDEEMNYLVKIWSGDDLTQLSRGAYVEVFKKALAHPKLFTIVKKFL